MAKPRVPKKTTTTNGEAAVDATSTTIPAANGNGVAVEAATPKTSTRKPSIVKSEVRPNVVPINLEDEIRRLAYLLSERRGFEPGHEADDWIAAEREVLQRYHQHSA
ncbi:MAG TPA: DUF2934 domain-containing protein [Candidatus Eisenbacteria bacterium]|nr:DUF2934 domain-containing protein [Candidatus Eisenbacteria bacterium]